MIALRRMILPGVMTIVAVVLLLALFLGLRNGGLSPEVTHLNSGWILVFDGKSSDVSSLENYKLPRKLSVGDTVRFERILPDTLNPHPVLRFKTYHSKVRVFAAGEKVYSFGDNYLGDGFVGSGFHYAFLNHKSLGQKLIVEIIPMEKDAFSVMPGFDVLPENGALTDYNAGHMLTIIVGVFLVIFGALSVVSTLALSFFGMLHFRLLMIGLQSLLLGIWSLCYMMVLQIFSVDFAYNTLLEYVTLYLAPLPLCLFLLSMRRNSMGNKKALGLKILLGVDIVFFIVASVLHILDVCHYTDVLWIFHLFILAGFVYLMLFVIGFGKSRDLSSKLLSYGVFLFVVISALDLLRYNLYRNFLSFLDVLEDTWIPIGILILVLFLLAGYLANMHKLIMDKAEKDLLASMVYVDSLTGLFNRAKCQQIFEVLDRSSTDYAVVSLDMNGLKFVNDKFGHAAGDELLKAFAGVFKQAFSGVGTSIRMGGDEFLSIVRKEHLQDVDTALERMMELQKSCPVKLPVPLEVAYGVAYHKEGDSITAEDVYKAADQKMYDMKSSMKSDLVRR